MPDEAAILEPVTAEPVVEAPPTPEPVVPDGGDVPATEGSEGEPKDYSAIEAELEAEVERRVTERSVAVEADAEKRVRQRTKEADDGHSDRTNFYARAENAARQSAAKLRQLVDDGEVIDQKLLNDHLNPMFEGVQSMAARENETTIAALTEAALPDITEAEEAALESLLYDFRRNGRFGELPVKVLELSNARLHAEIADLKKQLGNRTAVAAAAEKLASVAEAAGPGVGAETPKGNPPTNMDSNKLAQRVAFGKDSDGNVVTQADRDEFNRRY